MKSLFILMSLFVFSSQAILTPMPEQVLTKEERAKEKKKAVRGINLFPDIISAEAMLAIEAERKAKTEAKAEKKGLAPASKRQSSLFSRCKDIFKKKKGSGGQFDPGEGRRGGLPPII